MPGRDMLLASAATLAFFLGFAVLTFGLDFSGPEEPKDVPSAASPLAPAPMELACKNNLREAANLDEGVMPTGRPSLNEAARSYLARRKAGSWVIRRDEESPDSKATVVLLRTDGTAHQELEFWFQDDRGWFPTLSHSCSDSWAFPRSVLRGHG